MLLRDLRTLSLAALSLFVIVQGCVPTANPYDPDAPAETQAKARVQGRVIAEHLGSPEGLVVELVSAGEVAFSASTGGEGSFSIDDVTPGPYTLEVRVTGFLPFLLPVTLLAGETLKMGDIVLVAQSGDEASLIVGVATLEGQGEDGHGGILVEAVGRSFTAVTSSSGAFQLPVVAGSYDLRFSKASFQSVTVDEVEVAVAEEHSLDAVVLAANPATLTGNVLGEDASGAMVPLGDATVTLEGTALTALSNSAGDFTLGGVPPGSHLLRVVKDGYVGQSATVPNVVGGETRPLGVFSLHLSRGGISGTIALADTADASGVIIELTGTDRALLTGSSGAFVFDDVLLGSYSLSARKDGYNARNLGTFTVSADVVTSTGSFTLSRRSGLVSIVEGAATNAPAISLLITAPTATGYKASEDPAFQDPSKGDVEADAFRAFVPGEPAPFTLTDADGAHTVYVITSDGTTTSAPASAEVVLDRQAPVLSTLVIGGGSSYLASLSGIVTLHVEGFDLPPAAAPGVAVSGIVKMHLANEPTFAGAPVLDYRTTTTYSLDSPQLEGAKTVHGRVEDAAGNLSEVVSVTVVLDNTAPTDVSLVLDGDSEAPGYTRSPFLTAVLFAEDDNGGVNGADLLVRLSNDPGFVGAAYQPFSGGLLSWLVTPGDGEKTVYAQVRDLAGNESLVVSDALTLDTAAPSGAFVLVNAGSATTTSASVTLALSASGASEMALSQDGFASGTTWEPYASSKTYLLSDEGIVTVSAKFRDDAGWQTGVVTDSIAYDATAPAAGTLSLTGTLGDGRSSTTLTASGIVLADPLPALAERGEPLSMALVQSSDATCSAADFPASPLFVPYGRSSVVLSAGDGDKTVCVIFRDAAGNFDRATARGASIRLDGTAPSTPTFDDVTSGLTNETAVTATLTPAVDAGGAVTHRCFGGATFGNGGAVCDPASPVLFALREDAENTLIVRGCDAAANCAEARVTVVQDATPPLTPVLEDIAAHESSISLSWLVSASPDVAGYALYYGSAPGDRGSADAEQGASPIFVGDVTSFQLSGLAQGTTYYVSVAAIDEAGNLGDPSGELAATPSKASVRFLSSLGGRPRQLGVFETRGYIAEPQGIVQVDLSQSAAGAATTGRATVPNVVPDDHGSLSVIPCTAGGVLGDCVLFYGSTLEGELRRNRDNYRAGTSLVYFPPGGTADAPVTGRVLTTLPNQARAVVVDPEDDSRFYVVEATRVAAYELRTPPGSSTDAPFLRGSSSHATRLKVVLSAGVVGDYFYTVGLPFEPNLACQADQNACVELYASDRTELLAKQGVDGDALGMLSAQGGGPVVTFSPFTEVGYAFANGLNIVRSVPNATDGTDLLLQHHHVDGSGLLPLTPTSNRRVVLGSRSYPDPILAVAQAGRVYLSAPGEEALQQIYSVNVSASGALSAGPSGARFPEDPQKLTALAVDGGYVFGAEAATVPEAEQMLMRWTVPASGALPPFGDVLVPPTGTAMAYSDGLVFLGQGRNIYTFDVTNARAPTLLGAPARNPTRVTGSYDRLRVQRHLLFASSAYGIGIDVFRYDGASRRLVYVNTIGSNQYTDFAVIGDRLYASWTVSSNFTPGFDRFSLTTLTGAHSSSVCQGTPVPWHVAAFAVRHDTAYLYSHNDEFRVIDIDTCTARSSDLVLPRDPVSGIQRHVSVSGTKAIVSGRELAFAVNVASPTNPSLNAVGELSLAGATTQVGGYIVGLGAVDLSTGTIEPGPRLVSPFGGIDGFLAHAPCGQAHNGFSSLVQANGLLFASCGELGVQIVSLAHATGGRVLQEQAGYPTFTYHRDSVASDGNFAFLGANNTLYDINAELFGTDYPSVFLPAPAQNTALGTPRVESLLHVDGTVVTVTNLVSPPGRRIDLRDASDVDSPWPVTVGVTLSGSVVDTPVTNGRMLYVPDDTGIRYYALGDHNQLSHWGTSLASVSQIALSRDRLYALEQVGASTFLKVYRLLDNGHLPASSQGSHQLKLPSGFEPQDLFVHGGQVLITMGSNTGETGIAIFDDPGLLIAPVEAAAMRLVRSTQPLADPIVSGDVLFVAENLGVSSFDVSGTFSPARADPVRLGSIATGDATTGPRVDLEMAGPFLFLVGDRYRVFDMR